MDISDTTARTETRRKRASQSCTSVRNMRRWAQVPSYRNSVVVIAFFCTNVLCVHSSSLLFSKEPQSQDALHGRSAMLRCEVSEAAGVRYSWLQDGRPVQNSERRFMEDGNLKFSAVDRRFDTGNFQCLAESSSSGEVARSTNASFNIKWLDSGPVTLKEPVSVEEIDDAEQIVLQCQIDGHPRPNNKWYRDGVMLTVKERSLTLRKPVPGDSGTYRCCARNGAGQLCSTTNFTLNIIDKTIPRVLVAPKDQVVFRNEEAVFHCQFTARPPPVVEWFHESEPVVNKPRVVVHDNGTLRITQVKPRSTGRYICAVNYGTDKQVQVEATLHIAEIDDMPGNLFKFFSANEAERITCYPPRGHPEPIVWWEKDGAPVATKGRVHQLERDLIFNPTAVGDSGTYTCMAQNKAGQRRQDVRVTVAGPPEWVTRPQDTEMEEGQPGYLHCHIQATPPAQVTWYRNMQEITEKSQFKLFSNGTLRINSVEVYDGQVYNCICKTAGGFLNGQAKVYVLEKLKFTPAPQSPQCLQLDKEASVQCSATGRETPTIHWIKADGSAIPAHVKQINGTLLFEKVRRTDAGNYTCVASNHLQGEIRAYVALTVGVYTEFKLEPEYTTVYQGHTATLHCQATGDPQPYIQWIVKDKALSVSTSRFQEMPNGSLTISDVTTADTGKYTCIAGNSCGIRHRVAQLYVVEKPNPNNRDIDEGKTPYKMIQTIGLSVGAAVAYIIAVLGLMFYCKKRRNAKRLQKGQDADEPEMECLNGSAMQHNGQTTAEIQEEVALTNLETVSTAEKRHSNTDKLHFPRADLQTITTLGKGQFGEVFLAKARGIEENEEQTVVLVKSLLSRDEPSQAEFKRQLEMFNKPNHTNVVRLLGLCNDTEPHYMILEYIDLGDLKQFLTISKSKEEKLKPQPMSTKTKVSICAQVAAGMEHLSHQRVVHKDLATRNCLISGERHVKISALGLSKDVYSSEYHHYKQSLIPLRWLPAESVFENDFSTKSDVWAFGVLMWEVFSHGELPYSTLSHPDVLEELQAGTLKLSAPEACPSKVYKLMSRCWAPSVKERPSFTELIQTLGDIPLDSKV